MRPLWLFCEHSGPAYHVLLLLPTPTTNVILEHLPMTCCEKVFPLHARRLDAFHRAAISLSRCY
jgi:hypothetical protein